MIVYLCDQCDTVVSENALREGLAQKKGGEVTCENCLNPQQTNRELLHCDRCEKQFSGELLRNGDAIFVHSKYGKAQIYCNRCRGYAERKLKENTDLKYLSAIFVLFLGIPLLIGAAIGLNKYIQTAGKKAQTSPEIDELREELRKEIEKLKNSQKTSQKTSTSDLKNQLQQLQASVKGNNGSLDSATNSQIAKLQKQLADMKDLVKEKEDKQKASDIVALQQQLEDLKAQIKSSSGNKGPDNNAKTSHSGGQKELVDLVIQIEKNAAKEVRQIITQGNAQEKFAAILHVMRFGERASAPALIKALNDKDPLVRSYAAKALGTLGIKESIDKLIASVSDPNPNVRKSITQALRILTGQEFKDYNDLSQEEWEKLKRIKEQGFK